MFPQEDLEQSYIHKNGIITDEKKKKSEYNRANNETLIRKIYNINKNYKYFDINKKTQFMY